MSPAVRLREVDLTSGGIQTWRVLTSLSSASSLFLDENSIRDWKFEKKSLRKYAEILQYIQRVLQKANPVFGFIIGKNKTPDQPLSHHANDWYFQCNFCGKADCFFLCVNLIFLLKCAGFPWQQRRSLGHLVAPQKPAVKHTLNPSIFQPNRPGWLFFSRLGDSGIEAGPTLTAAATVGGWWRSGGVKEEDEEVTSRPSGINLIIQLRSSQTPSGATRQRSLCDTFRYQQHNELSWSMNGERVLHLNTPTPTVFHSTYLSCLAACSLI